jgi:hypothetical protein
LINLGETWAGARRPGILFFKKSLNPKPQTLNFGRCSYQEKETKEDAPMMIGKEDGIC